MHHLTVFETISETSADPESFARGGPSNFDNVFLFVFFC